MKCEKCGNEEFILTEEAGKYHLHLIPLFIPIVIIAIGLTQKFFPIFWYNILDISMSKLELLSIKYLSIGGVLFIVIFSINTYKKFKLRSMHWIKTSRTKATCSKCYQQYYLNMPAEVYTGFYVIRKEYTPDKQEKIEEDKKPSEPKVS